MLKKISVVLILITWPLSLFVNNTFKDFLSYVFPFFNPKFAILLLIFVLIYFKISKACPFGIKKPIIISILILILFFKPFFGQTIFRSDYEAQQQNLQKSNLYHGMTSSAYNSIFLARLFQNKAHIPLDKFTNNFFALTDPNNYFFGFAPRQIIVDNQNLKKFPFLSLPFLLIGLYFFAKQKHWKLILAILVASIINLSILTNFDRNDFILWIPLSLTILHGLNMFISARRRGTRVYLFLFVLFSCIELLRIFIR